MKLVKKWLGEDKPCIRNSSNIALIFVLMLVASVTLTGCADEEYVDEAYYQEEDGEYSGGDIEENGEEYTGYDTSVEIGESVDSAADFGNGVVNGGRSTVMRSVRRGSAGTRYGSSGKERLLL